MNRYLLLSGVYLADQIAGDPEWFPHPVRCIGWAITEGESLLRRPHQSNEGKLLAGAALTTTVGTTSYFLTRLLISEAYRHSKMLGWLTEVTLGWTCLAARNLQDEASLVLTALDSGDMELARGRLARIVGRDTMHLDDQEISRAVIETLAESASDGVIAPFIYMSAGGVPLAMAYKAVNTLDSMIGHADERYFYFGKVAARLDDAANFVPARLTALATVVASGISAMGDPRSAWNIWLRDGSKHKSPNAGQPESAMAGALRVRLGGGNTYGGAFLPAEPIGEEFPAPRPEHARKAIRVVSVITLLGLGVGMLLQSLLRSRRSA
jgi:adenosylcobinamide-phosphate synthase